MRGYSSQVFALCTNTLIRRQFISCHALGGGLGRHWRNSAYSAQAGVCSYDVTIQTIMIETLATVLRLHNISV